MKNSNVIIALVVGLVLGLVIGRMTVDMGGEGSGTDEVASGHVGGSPDPSPAAKAAAETDEEIFKIEVDNAWFKGSEDALVTIVEFSNFQCGFCGRVQGTLKQLLEEYGDKVRLAFMHMPLPNMPDTMIAAQANEAAGAQGKFWEYHEKLFENPRALDRENLESYAEELGLDMERFRADLDNEVHKAKVEQHVRTGQSLGVRGTPGFFINGRSLRGAQPIENFKAVIDEEIERAEAVLAAGVKQRDLYPTLIAEGRTGTAPQRAAERRQPPPRPQFGRPNLENAHSHGPEDALVTIVEYSNIQCGFCVRVRPTIQRIKEEYGDKILVIWKHQTRPGPGMLVAQAAEAAGEQGKFFEFMDKAFANPREIGRE
ncbi:MAG: DsbA family protein, partial [Myxococcota bacterium]